MSEQDPQRSETRAGEAPVNGPPRRRRAGPRTRPKSGDYVIVEDCWMSRAEARRRGLVAE